MEIIFISLAFSIIPPLRSSAGSKGLCCWPGRSSVANDSEALALLQWVMDSPLQHPLVGPPHCWDNSGHQRNFARSFSLQKATSQFEVCALSTFTPDFPSCYLSGNSKCKKRQGIRTFVGLEIRRPVPKSFYSPNFIICVGRSCSQHLHSAGCKANAMHAGRCCMTMFSFKAVCILMSPRTLLSISHFFPTFAWATEKIICKIIWE